MLEDTVEKPKLVCGGLILKDNTWQVTLYGLPGSFVVTLSAEQVSQLIMQLADSQVTLIRWQRDLDRRGRIGDRF